MYKGTYLTEEKFIRFIDKDYKYRDDKTAMIAAINEMDEAEAKRFRNEINELIDFKNTYVGKFCFDKENEPNFLLRNFWQRSSDACPLEASAAENQEDEFHDWVLDQYEEITFPI